MGRDPLRVAGAHICIKKKSQKCSVLRPDFKQNPTPLSPLKSPVAPHSPPNTPPPQRRGSPTFKKKLAKNHKRFCKEKENRHALSDQKLHQSNGGVEIRDLF